MYSMYIIVTARVMKGGKVRFMYLMNERRKYYDKEFVLFELNTKHNINLPLKYLINTVPVSFP